ncbi:MAG: RagB/SusD family nutrient uptake outer membrane protein [Rikenellaceae bacterium]
MKNIKLYILLGAAVTLFASCEDYLTLTPETSLSPSSFFASEEELELWTNRFYYLFNDPDTDAIQMSDLQISKSLSSLQQGTRSASTQTWSWVYLRYINYFLENSSNCEDESIRAQYESVSYFFRALFYFDKVRQYGDVPYYDYVLESDDWESLKKARDSRGYVMYKVMEDLDKAVENLPEAWSSDALYRVSKNAALALKSRAALYEGTFRKYHSIADETVDGVTVSADYFLGLAAEAAKSVIEKNAYKLYTDDEYLDDQPYREFFILEDANSDETILSMRFNVDLLVRHGVQFTYRNMRHSGTRHLADHYLMADGSKVQDQENYATMLYWDQFQDRDPRMSQTLMAPGYVALNGIDAEIENCYDYDMTGYRIIKHISDSSHDGATTSTTDWSIFRYPEVLLNYAEALAELGTITQADIDMSINMIRDRVGMAGLSMEEANALPDNYLASYYSNVESGANQGVILEIRRERTVELYAEGLRQWDMLRWREGAKLVAASNGDQGFLGVYFPELGEYDMDGDGVNDLCLWSGTRPSTTCDSSLQIGSGYDAELTDGESGYIVCYRDQSYTWNEDRDYLWPIPKDQIIATGGALEQNPGWE